MTTIVLHAREDKLYLAADRREIADTHIRPKVNKIVHYNNWAIAGAGDTTSISVLTQILSEIEPKPFEFNEFETELRASLGSSSVSISDDELAAGLIAVGYSDAGIVTCIVELALTKLTFSYSSVDLNDFMNSENKSLGIGCGGRLAIGVLLGLLHNSKGKVNMKKKIEETFEITASLDAFTSKEFDLVEFDLPW